MSDLERMRRVQADNAVRDPRHTGNRTRDRPHMTETPFTAPYTDCWCEHGRHTHVRYVGACGLCDCPAVSPKKGQDS